MFPISVSSAMIVGVVIIVAGSFLVAIQRCGGVNIRQLSRVGIDKIVGVATRTAGTAGLKNASSGSYHPMGDGFKSGTLFGSSIW